MESKIDDRFSSFEIIALQKRKCHLSVNAFLGQILKGPDKNLLD